MAVESLNSVTEAGRQTVVGNQYPPLKEDAILGINNQFYCIVKTYSMDPLPLILFYKYK